jgi:mRNA interferase MazF
MLRPIHLAQLEKLRPVLVLTREEARFTRSQITVAPITSTIRGLSSELIVDERNGLDHRSVVNLDTIVTIKMSELKQNIGFLLGWQEELLAEAIHTAFALR